MFKLSQSQREKNKELFNAYESNDMIKMKQLQYNNAKLPNSGYCVDIATENGHNEMTKFLVTEFEAQPSLYAKQMATINGHNDLVNWLDNNSTQRNDISIDIVHRRFNKQSGKFEWHDCIPVEFRILKSSL